MHADSADGPMHLIVTFRATNIHSTLKRILQKVRQQNFNCFEVTGIVAKRFLGVPYVAVSGHSRHVQQSCMLDGIQERQRAQSGSLEAEYGRH